MGAAAQILPSITAALFELLITSRVVPDETRSSLQAA